MRSQKMADWRSTQLSEEVIRKKLMLFNDTQDSVQGLSLWIMHNKAHHKKIIDTWLKVLRNCEVKHKLTLFYLCNDVVQHAKKKKALYYLENFRDNLREAVKVVREYDSIKPNVGRIFNIWEERKIYDVKFINEIKLVLNGESSSRGSSASGTPAMSSPVMYTLSEVSERPSQKDKPMDKPIDIPVSKQEEGIEKAEDIEPDVLGEFKMSTFLENISTLTQQEVEITQKAKQLASLQIDATNIEAVKQLKDHSQGQEFYRQFEMSCEKIEDYFAILEKEKKQRENVLFLCNEAESFYNEQFKEAKIVATAYKNFGARVTNMKKRVDDMKKIIPATPSPVPSPNADAPSLGNTPAMSEMDNVEMVDMDLGNDDREASKGQGTCSNILDSRIANLIPSLAKGFSSIVSQEPPLPASGAVSTQGTLAPPLSTFETQVEEPEEPDLGQEMYDPSMADDFLLDDNSSSTPVQDEQDNMEEKEIVPSPSLQTVASLIISPPRLVSPVQKASPPRQISPLWNSSPPRIVSPAQKISPPHKVSPPQKIVPSWKISPPHRFSLPQKASPHQASSPHRASSPQKVSPLHRASPPWKVSPPRKVSPSWKVSPPRRASLPQKPTETKVKTNPIDFLSQLLTKTSNSSSSSNFLQTLSLLTNTVKSQYKKRHEIEDVPKQDVRVSADPLTLPSEGSFSGVPPPPQTMYPVSWPSWNSGNGNNLSQPLQQQDPDLSASPMMQQSKAGPFPLQPPLLSHLPPPEHLHPMLPLSSDFSISSLAGPPTISQSFVNPLSIPPPPSIANQFSLPACTSIFPQISNSQTLPSHSAASVTLGPRHPGTVYNPLYPFGQLSPSVSESVMAPPHCPIPQIQGPSPVTSQVFFSGNIDNWNTLRTENQPPPSMHSGFLVAPPPPPDSVVPPPWPHDPPLNPNRFINDRYGNNQHSEDWEQVNLNSHSTEWESMNPNYKNNSWKLENNSESGSSNYGHPWDQLQECKDKEEDKDYEEQQPVLPSSMKSILRNNRISSLREVTLVDQSESSGSHQNYTGHLKNVGGDIPKRSPIDFKTMNTMIDVHSEFVEKVKQNSGASATMLVPLMGRRTLTTIPTLDTLVSQSKQSSHNPVMEHGEFISTTGKLGSNGCSAKPEEMETYLNEEMEYSGDVNLLHRGDHCNNRREFETKRWKGDDAGDCDHKDDVGGPLQRPGWQSPKPIRQLQPRIPGPDVYHPRSFEPRPYFQEDYRGASLGERPFFSPHQRLPYNND